jgi:hypothetical protein
MNAVLDPRDHKFCPDELVTLHYQSGSKQIPVSAVVVSQEMDKVLVKAHIQGKIETFYVDKNQVVMR